MPAPLAIISALLPPLRGGLADHTHLLATHLAPNHPVSVITSASARPAAPPAGAPPPLATTTGAPDSPHPYTVLPHIQNWRDPGQILNAILQLPSNAVLLWQYVPHMYGRGGVNRAIPNLIQHLHSIGRKQIVIAHEIRAEWSWRPDLSWHSFNHRLQWRRILRNADAVAVSTETWLNHWQARVPERAHRLFLLPSPSNFEPVPVPHDHAALWRREHHLPPKTPILGYFGQLRHHPLRNWVFGAWKDALQTIGPTALAVVGDDPQLPQGAGPQELYLPLGHLDSTGVSRALHAFDLLMFPFIDGAAERRSSLMAGLSHRRPVISTAGHSTGPSLRSADGLMLVDVHDQPAFHRTVVRLLGDRDAAAELGRKGRGLYDSRYSWPLVAARMARRIETVLAEGDTWGAGATKMKNES